MKRLHLLCFYYLSPENSSPDLSGRSSTENRILPNTAERGPEQVCRQRRGAPGIPPLDAGEQPVDVDRHGGGHCAQVDPRPLLGALPRARDAGHEPARVRQDGGDPGQRAAGLGRHAADAAVGRQPAGRVAGVGAGQADADDCDHERHHVQGPGDGAEHAGRRRGRLRHDCQARRGQAHADRLRAIAHDHLCAQPDGPDRLADGRPAAQHGRRPDRPVQDARLQHRRLGVQEGRQRQRPGHQRHHAPAGLPVSVAHHPLHPHRPQEAGHAHRLGQGRPGRPRRPHPLVARRQRRRRPQGAVSRAPREAAGESRSTRAPRRCRCPTTSRRASAVAGGRGRPRRPRP